MVFFVAHAISTLSSLVVMLCGAFSVSPLSLFSPCLMWEIREKREIISLPRLPRFFHILTFFSPSSSSFRETQEGTILKGEEGSPKEATAQKSAKK